MNENTGTLYTVSDIVRDFETTHGKVYRMIRMDMIPATAITQEKYKGRKGWRHRITAAAVDALNLSPRTVVMSETPYTEASVA